MAGTPAPGGVGTTPPTKPAVPPGAALTGATACWGANGTPPRSCITGGATRSAGLERTRKSMITIDS
eukprot:scaffold60557_cov48-Phaeocystis_antarctica.AAC.3